MKVLLIQLDGFAIPNHALQRIAAHHLALGDSVELGRSVYVGRRFDRIYASAIFEKTLPKVAQLRQWQPQAIIGGSAVSLDLTLADVGITNDTPDYSLWPEFKPSLGYSQRGCRLSCSFCGVPRKEGKPSTPVSINQIWRGHGHPKEVLLLDNDFFGLPQWRDRISELNSGGFKVSFNQGVNLRLMDEEQCAAIASTNYRDADMKTKRFYTAWDNRRDEKVLFRGLEWLCKHGMKPDHIMVYMLVGYCHAHKGPASTCQCPEADTHEQREYRRRQLREFGCRPYPMPYERTRQLIGFQRWVVRRLDINVPWDKFQAVGYRPENLEMLV